MTIFNSYVKLPEGIYIYVYMYNMYIYIYKHILPEKSSHFIDVMRLRQAALVEDVVAQCDDIGLLA